MWVGRPPCDTIVDGAEPGGRGTKVEVLWVSGVPNGSVAMAWSLPIQWMARRKEVDPPNDLGA